MEWEVTERRSVENEEEKEKKRGKDEGQEELRYPRSSRSS